MCIAIKSGNSILENGFVGGGACLCLASILGNICNHSLSIDDRPYVNIGTPSQNESWIVRIQQLIIPLGVELAEFPSRNHNKLCLFSEWMRIAKSTKNISSVFVSPLAIAWVTLGVTLKAVEAFC